MGRTMCMELETPSVNIITGYIIELESVIRRISCQRVWYRRR